MSGKKKQPKKQAGSARKAVVGPPKHRAVTGPMQAKQQPNITDAGGIDDDEDNRHSSEEGGNDKDQEATEVQ